MDHPQLLSALDAAAFLGISKSKFNEYKKAGLIKHFQPRPCDAKMYPVRDLFHFIRSHTSSIKPTAKPTKRPNNHRRPKSEDNQPPAAETATGAEPAGQDKIFSIYDRKKTAEGAL